MTLYCLMHSRSQRCPECNSGWLVLYTHAEHPQQAATARALCPDCMNLPMGTSQRADVEHLRIIHPWYGVDLDGTLAHTVPVETIEQIGEPLMPMVQRVRQLLAEGKDVRIFTARVAATGAYSPWSMRFDDREFARRQTHAINAWCLRVFGQQLPVTATKDFAMVELYDDRARQVVLNAGTVVSEELERYAKLTGAMK